MDKIRSLFKNKDLYDQATKLALNGHKSGYERLEFLGDRVIGLIVAKMLYEQYPNEPEGLLAKRFVALTCGKTMAKITKDWGLDSFTTKSARCIRNNKSILSDVCESIVGALYLDQGLKAAEDLVMPIWTPIMLSFEEAPQDYKSTLQEYCQKNFGTLPKYTLLEQHGQAHAPEFTIKLEVDSHTKIARGKSIKAAEQEAAYQLMQEIQND